MISKTMKNSINKQVVRKVCLNEAKNFKYLWERMYLFICTVKIDIFSLTGQEDSYIKVLKYIDSP